jgi:hypothetical protein
MVSPSLTFWAAMGLAAGPIWFVHGFSSFRRKRLIENTPTARIRSMAMGLVEVNGKVSGRSSLQAPFSGRPCVFWQVEIAEVSKKRGSGHVIHRNESGQPFYIRDDSGTALVYPHGAECRVRYGVEEDCLGVSLPECYAAYLKEHLPPGFWRFGTLRFRERVLEEGDGVYILGTAMPRSKAVAISEGEDLAATGTDGGVHRAPIHDEGVVATIRKGANERTFLISQASERELLFTLGLRSLGGLVGGPIVTLMCLAYWLITFSTFLPRR